MAVQATPAEHPELWWTCHQCSIALSNPLPHTAESFTRDHQLLLVSKYLHALQCKKKIFTLCFYGQPLLERLICSASDQCGIGVSPGVKGLFSRSPKQLPKPFAQAVYSNILPKHFAQAFCPSILPKICPVFTSTFLPFHCWMFLLIIGCFFTQKDILMLGLPFPCDYIHVPKTERPKLDKMMTRLYITTQGSTFLASPYFGHTTSHATSA